MGFDGGGNPQERFYLDNVLISTQSASPPTSLPGSAPPALVSADDGYNLMPGEAMTVTFQVTVDDPLNPALASLVNVAFASSDQQLAPITDDDVNLVQVCFGPGAPTVSAAQLDATTLRLSWPAVAGAGEYRVYRGTTPYFTPTEPAYQVLTATTFDDPGVIGDPNTQYYYVVQSACPGGASSGASNRVGAYDFALNSPGAANYNDIAMVFDMPGVKDAASLATYVGGSVIRILRYENVSQSLRTYIVGLSFTNFAVNPGDYLFLLTNGSAPSTLALVGNVPDPGTVSFGLTSGSGVAYNPLSLPLDQCGLTAASALTTDIGGGVLRVLRYRNGSQHSKPISLAFHLQISQSYAANRCSYWPDPACPRPGPSCIFMPGRHCYV